MWVKKTQEEINNLIESQEKIKRIRSALKGSIIAFIISLLLSILYLKINGDEKFFAKEYCIGKPYSWDEIFQIPLYYLLLPLIVSLIVFFYKLLTGENIISEDNEDLFICEKCNKLTNKYNMRCSCGGEFIRSDKMKWIDEGNDEKIED
jgi:hypothetical protein